MLRRPADDAAARRPDHRWVLPTTDRPPTTDVAPAPAPPGWIRRHPRLALVATGLGVAVSVLADRGALVVVAAVFVLVVPVERIFPRHRQRLRRPHLATDLAYALAATPLQLVGLVVGAAIGVLSMAWVPGLLLRPLVTALPPVPRLLLGLFLFDLAIYWVHRLGHEAPFLWRFHRIHHSTEHLDWVSGFRSHPLDGVLLGPPFVLLIAAGFDPRTTGVVLAVQLVAGLFVHANVRWRLRPLQKLVATPEVHHWHHADDPAAWNTNYAAMFPVHDLVFGTFYAPRDRRPARYGIGDPVPAGILAQLWEPLRGLPNPIRALAHPGCAVRAAAGAIARGAVVVAWILTHPVRRPPAPPGAPVAS